MSSRLPRDTPVDTPAVTGVSIELGDLGPDAGQLGAQALARAQSVETLEVAYAAWAELKDAHRAAKRRWKEEHEQLTQQGALLLGAVRVAGAAPAATSVEGLAPTTALDDFLHDAKQKLAAAEAQLEARVAAAEQSFRTQLTAVREALRERVRRQAGAVKPVFKLAVRVLPGDRRVLHAHRLGHDEAVVALFALTERIPSRYDALLDDSTDDLSAAPPALYPDEGVEDVRPNAPSLGHLLAARAEVWPVKGVLPLTFPDGTWMWWRARGAVLEAEVQDGEGFRSVLSSVEAERITGLLLGHKLAGRIELELVRD